MVEREGHFVREPCLNEATTEREDWRWGDRSKAESLIVRLNNPLCADCARDWDELEADGKAEAAAS